MSWTFNSPPGWPVPAGWQPPVGWAPDPAWPPAPAGWQFWVAGEASGAPAAESPAGPASPASPASPGGPAGPAGASPGVHEAPTSLAYPAGPQPAGPQQTPPYPTPGYPGSGPPAAGTPAVRPWHQRWWAITGTLLSVLLVGCVAGGVVAILTDSGDDGGNSPADAAPAPPASAASPDEAPDDAPDDAPEPEAPAGLGPGQERTGTGPTIVALGLPANSLHTVTLTHTGEGVFHVRLLDTAGEFARSVASGIGDFSGTFPLELRAYGEPGSIDIVDGDGTWTVEIQDLSEAPLWPDETTGTGPAVLRVDPDSDASSVSVSHHGQSNVFVWGHVEGEVEDLMINEIGEYSGDVSLRAGTFLLEIDADGEWSIEPS